MPNTTAELGAHDVDRVVEHADCVVFDFYLTLCSEFFFGPLGESVLSQIQRLLWGRDQSLLDQWMMGCVSASQIALYLSQHLDISAKEIEAGLREGCRGFVLHEAIWAFAQAVRKAGKRIALVTVNTDVFSEEVVPSLSLDQVFEVIVNSADHGELDKSRLWPIAFEALGGGISYPHSFLLEDGAHSPAKFTAAGGKAYQYTDDASFMTWLSTR